MPNNAKITIIGNLTKDPVVRPTGSGNVTGFTVAVNTSVKDTDGKFKSNFYDVSVWGKLGENLIQKLQKGSQVWVVGNFYQDEYIGTDNNKHVGLRISADDVRGLNRLKETTNNSQPQNTNSGDNEMPF